MDSCSEQNFDNHLIPREINTKTCSGEFRGGSVVSMEPPFWLAML